MLDNTARLRVMASSMDCDVMSFRDPGRTIEELLEPGMFDTPAKVAGVLPQYDRPIVLYVFAKDGPAIFCSMGVERNGKGEGHTMRFSVMRPEPTADIELSLSKRRTAA